MNVKTANPMQTPVITGPRVSSIEETIMNEIA